MKLKIIFCTDYANDSGFIEMKIRGHNLNRMMSRRSETGKFDQGHQDKTFIFRHKEPFKRYLSTQTLSNSSNIDCQNYVLYNADFHLHPFVATILTSATVVIALFFEELSKVSWISSLAHPFFALIVHKTIVSRGCVNGDRIIGVECGGSPRSGCHFLDCCSHFAVICEFPWISPFQAQCLK